ncbi:hypothetical protein BCR33DRAFT_720514 [Rhizoclosmatium globosum]|uniref:Iron permease FTR1 n=1 Tax=Rhizoclosmatium globosum TaxID=329046 RepID=A0A1Y2BVS5_9FUNG|nr:hypothetical protein BCR33DRAFT_720514 [Rhizoclosmatium globosum]|eukprot:ORY38846.1 hypothetical protein BCR33DRAFT_720514 [Rhizoclosmatium globosum]
MRKLLTRALWLGTAAGLLLSLAVGAVFLVIWFKYASNLWATAEALWEAILQLIACILMTIMGFAFLKSDELTAKWHRKLHKQLKEHEGLEEGDGGVNSDVKQTLPRTMNYDESEAKESDNFITVDNTPTTSSEYATAKDKLAEYEETTPNAEESECSSKTLGDVVSQRKSNKATQAFFWVPFLTVIREGLEGMLFLGGTAISEDPGHIPLAVIAALICGVILGYAIYRAGNTMKLHTFFIVATIVIFYLSAGLFAKSVWSYEKNTWNVQTGTVDGDSSQYYDIRKSVWHLTCCNPDDASQGGWQLFNALFGWSSSPTVGSITAYIVYWLAISCTMVAMKLMDRRRRQLGLEKVGFKRMIKNWFASVLRKN